MIIVNFAHPLTNEQRAKVEELTEQHIAKVYDVPCHFEDQAPFAEQAARCVEAVGLSMAEWQGNRLLINPPGYAPAACALMAEVHGRMGHFPTIMRIRPVAGSTPTTYEVAEIVNLQALRTEARNRRREVIQEREEITS